MLADSTQKNPTAALLLLRRGEETRFPPGAQTPAGKAWASSWQGASRGIAQLLAGIRGFTFIARVLTPGEISSQFVLCASVLVMAALTLLDQSAQTSMRLQILNLFPLAAIALHCERQSTLAAGLGLSLALQLLSYARPGTSFLPELADALVTMASSLLAMTLARASRANYLATVRLATTDWLTGLYNRRSFEAAAEREILRQRRYGGSFSLALLDLDGFKKLNDTRGHAVGDAALQHLAEVLRRNIRQSDLIARLGGDEFVVLMPNTKAADCLALCRQLAIVVGHRMAKGGFAVTASIGCASFDSAPESTRLALERADAALYAAKGRGKNCAVAA